MVTFIDLDDYNTHWLLILKICNLSRFCSGYIKNLNVKYCTMLVRKRKFRCKNKSIWENWVSFELNQKNINWKLYSYWKVFVTNLVVMQLMYPFYEWAKLVLHTLTLPHFFPALLDIIPSFCIRIHAHFKRKVSR